MAEPRTRWTSPVLWSKVESAAICWESGCYGALSAINRHVRLLPLFNIRLKVPLSLPCGDVSILAEGTGPAQSPSAYKTVQIKMSLHPCEQNRAPNWKPRYECFSPSVPLPPQHYIFIASFVGSTSDAPFFLALNKNNPRFPAVSMKTSSRSMSTKWELCSLCVLCKAGIFWETKLISHIFKVHGTGLDFSSHST